MGLADEIIKQNTIQEVENNSIGIDELGFPAPKVPNVDYVVARILAKDETLFKLNGAIYSHRKQIIRESQIPTSKQLFLMCGEPKIIVPDENSSEEGIYKWVEMTIRLIKTRSPVIYGRLYDLVPKYNKRYIQVTDGIIWDKEKGDFI